PRSPSKAKSLSTRNLPSPATPGQANRVLGTERFLVPAAHITCHVPNSRSIFPPICPIEPSQKGHVNQQPPKDSTHLPRPMQNLHAAENQYGGPVRQSVCFAGSYFSFSPNCVKV